MANTIGTPLVVNRGGPAQWTSLFNVAITFSATISDQDAVAIGDTAEFSITVNGAALGDLVLVAVDEDMSDGTDFATITAVVGAANTVDIRVNADAGEFAADTLNGKVVKGVVLRPAW